ALDWPQAAEEARSPVVPLDSEAVAFEQRRELTGRAKPDVRRILREHQIASLQTLDHVQRIRRVDRERSFWNEHASNLRQHCDKGLFVEMLDEIACDSLVERTGGERKRGDVGLGEPKPGEGGPRLLDPTRPRI